jgi:crotonobetainyl-CoA:carnitine CoA-transferase CaiB-like acyl-CoA transferase
LENPEKPTSLLKGIRILEVGKSDTLHIAGMLLADQGAEVIRLVCLGLDSKPLFHQSTDRAKKYIALANLTKENATSLQKLIQCADIVLTEAGSEVAEALQLNESDFPTVILCTIVPSTEYTTDDGPWSEETVSAAAGLYENVLGIGKPRFFDLPIASTLGALFAINSLAAALVGRERFGCCDRIVVPLDRIVMFSQALTTMIRSRAPTHWEPLRMLATPFMGVWKTAGNGYVYVHVGMPRHLRSFLFLLDKLGYSDEKKALKKSLDKATKRDPVLLASPGEALRITRILSALFLKKSAAEWEDLLGNAGLCCSKIRPFEAWRIHPQVIESKEIVTIAGTTGESIPVPGPLYISLKDEPHSVAANTSHEITIEQLAALWPKRGAIRMPSNPELPLAGIRVLDLSRVIAGPYAGRLLAEAGAQVLHVSLRKKHLSWEEPFHIVFNAGKESVVLDYTRPEAREVFQKLIADFKPNVLLHNFLDDAAKKIGCDFESAKRINPEIVYVDIKGYNQYGPWAQRPGFEQNVQAASGILATYSSGTTPQILPVPVNDLNSGLIASFGATLSLLRFFKNGEGNRVTSFLSMPSILINLHHLDTKRSDEKKLSYARYFRASDNWFLLMCQKSSLSRLKENTLLSRCDFSNGSSFEEELARGFRKKPVAWWIKNNPALMEIAIIPRTSVSMLLKMEILKQDPLFEYRDHPGFGSVLFAHCPVKTAHQKKPSPAPYFGSSNEKYLSAVRTEAASSDANIPPTKPTHPLAYFFRRALWFIGQARWLTVIAYRQRGLRPEKRHR